LPAPIWLPTTPSRLAVTAPRILLVSIDENNPHIGNACVSPSAILGKTNVEGVSAGEVIRGRSQNRCKITRIMWGSCQRTWGRLADKSQLCERNKQTKEEYVCRFLYSVKDGFRATHSLSTEFSGFFSAEFRFGTVFSKKLEISKGAPKCPSYGVNNFRMQPPLSWKSLKTYLCDRTLHSPKEAWGRFAEWRRNVW
jgi:hypothetical protein